MRQLHVLNLALIASATLLVAACATDDSMTSGTTAPSRGTASTPAPAGDSPLQTCLARISSAASEGTRRVAEESCRRDESVRLSIVGTALAKSNDRASSGTQGDSLEACMARIPKDATTGQRLMAEESCRRDQANRR